MNQLDRSLHGMELVTVDELEGLIESMKISNVVSMSMNDIAANLASLKMERSRNAEKFTKKLDSTSSAGFLTDENLKYDALNSTYNSNVGPYGNELQNRHKSMNLGTDQLISQVDDMKKSRSTDNREAKFSEEHGSSSDILRNFNDVNEKDMMTKSYGDTVPAPSEDTFLSQKRASGLSKFVNPRRASFTKLALTSKTSSQSNLDLLVPLSNGEEMVSSPSKIDTLKDSPESPDYMIDTVDVNWLLGTDEPKVEADHFPDTTSARESLPFKYTGTAAYSTVKNPSSSGYSNLLPTEVEVPLSSALDDSSSDDKGTDGAYSEEQKSKAFCDSDQSNRTYSIQSDSTEPGERIPRGKLPFGADASRNHDDVTSSWWGTSNEARDGNNNIGEYSSNTNSSMASRTNSYMRRDSNDNSSNTSTIDNNTVNRNSMFANGSYQDIPPNNGIAVQDITPRSGISRMDSLGRSLKRTSVTMDTSLISSVGDLESDDDDSSICTIGSDRFFSASQKVATTNVEVEEAHEEKKTRNVPARVGDMNTIMGDKAQDNSVCSSFNADRRRTSHCETISADISYLEGDSCFDSSFENTIKNADRALDRESYSDTDVTYDDYGSTDQSPRTRENGARSPKTASPSSPTTPSSSSFISASSPPYTPTPSVHGKTVHNSSFKGSLPQTSTSMYRTQGVGERPQGDGTALSPVKVQHGSSAVGATAQARTAGTYTVLSHYSYYGSFLSGIGSGKY